MYRSYLTMLADFWKVMTVASILITFFGTIVIAYSDALVKPDIQVTVNYTPEKNNLTLAEVNIENTGLKPATNVRITINPQNDIVNYTLAFYTEDINLKSYGSKSLVGKMDRLANQQSVFIDTMLNTTKVEKYAVFVTHDKGSTNYEYLKDNIKSPDVELILGVITSTIASGIVGVITWAIKTITLRKGKTNIQAY